MPQSKDNLPVNAEVQAADGGTITYANEVIAIISGIAANEVEGIAGMVTAGGLGEIISKNRNITRGVKVEVGTEEVSVDLYTIVEYGQPIQKVATEVQENVRKSIESMTGLHVVRVDVHVQGVSFEKEKRDIQNRLEAANIPALDGPESDKKAKRDKKPDKAPPKEEKDQTSPETLESPETPEAVPAENAETQEAAATDEPRADSATETEKPEPAEETPETKKPPVKRRKA